MNRIASMLAASVLAFGLLTTASAQADVMVVEFTPPDSLPTTHRVVVFVGEVACAEARFDSDSPPSVLLGTSEQPSACRAEGAEVTFLQFRAFETENSPIVPAELSERTTFAVGMTFEFINWAPTPSGGPEFPPHMRAFLESGATLLPNADTPVATGPAMTLDFTSIAALPGPLPERIVVFVEEIPCTEVRFDGTAPRIILLGTETQPQGCGIGAGGADVSFLQLRTSGLAVELFEHTFVVTYGRYELKNWAPQPPGTPLPGHMQAFVDTGATLQPARVGNVGLASDTTTPPAAVLLLATALLAFAARRLTAVRPH